MVFWVAANGCQWKGFHQFTGVGKKMIPFGKKFHFGTDESAKDIPILFKDGEGYQKCQLAFQPKIDNVFGGAVP